MMGADDEEQTTETTRMVMAAFVSSDYLMDSFIFTRGALWLGCWLAWMARKMIPLADCTLVL